MGALIYQRLRYVSETLILISSGKHFVLEKFLI